MIHLTRDSIDNGVRPSAIGVVGQIPSMLLSGPSINTTTTEQSSFKPIDARNPPLSILSNFIPLYHGARCSVIQRRRGTGAFEKKRKNRMKQRHEGELRSFRNCDR